MGSKWAKNGPKKRAAKGQKWGKKLGKYGPVKWAQKWLKMYLKWAEIGQKSAKNGLKTVGRMAKKREKRPGPKME